MLATAWSEAADRVRFNRDIRPILSDNCFACHGPDAATRKARLRLDTREGLFADLSGDAVVAPGRPAASLVFQRVSTEDADDLMPPPKSGKILTPAQRETIRTWIEQGAKWEGHWAYLPLERPALPPVTNADWGHNPIDRFILAKIEQEGFAPAAEADRRTLIRRLSFDLAGLPPSPDETEAFVADPDPAAYERLVDRLLASPHFGERLALYWLDLVRYADTDGFHADNYRSVWPYRDYVIRAFNENKPFDQFTVEQLAGDLLPDATVETRVASTYNRLGRSTEEGGAQPKEYLLKYAADRVRSVGSVWLGSTTGCAECHDHKFDPYTMKDFYRLAAFFADVQEQGVGKREGSPVPTAAQSAELARLDDQLSRDEQALKTFTPGLRVAFAEWEQATLERLADEQPAWLPTEPASLTSSGGANLERQADGTILSSGANPPRDSYTVVLPARLPHLTALRLEVLTHPEFPNHGLGRGNGNIVLSEVTIALRRSGSDPVPVPIARAIADFSQNGWPIENVLDGKPETGWAVAGHEKPADHQAAFIFERPVAGDPDAELVLTLRHESAHERHNIGRFRVSLTGVEAPTLDPDALPADILAALQTASDARPPEQNAALESHFLAITPQLDEVRARLAATRQARKELEARIPTTLMTVAGEPRITRVLPRGNWMDESGEIVQPAPPEFLAGAPPGDRRQTRLELGRWLVSDDNPLTPRVFVNRLWRLFHGVGLSKNVTDFGAQGEWPRHPELLDWLAVEFRDSGWDVKHLVRLLVTSATYRQSSEAAAEVVRRDPYNRLHARQSRFRLGAEMIRDNALAVSGLLIEDIGGPSVKPYQPAGYWDQLNFPKRTWEADQGQALYRRGLYVFWCRTFLHPSLLSFDACTREEGSAERTPSNTPLQALTLLNDPIFVEAARVFAGRILREGGDQPEARLAWAVRQTLGRAPHPAETGILIDLYQSERERYAADPEAAKALSSVGRAPASEDLPPVELAAWTEVARTLINLDETIVRN
ncbi:MAG: PSD1 domain-containing protein [Verrucomicrobiales bacterium]|nr:PSD1 domain-containing protein [Verrucomicrobiales bacterium]